MNAGPLPTTLPTTSAYLQTLSSLINTLTKRIIKFYRQELQDQLVFKQQIQEHQDSLAYYQQFKHPQIKCSALLEPLAAHLKLSTFKQYFSVPSTVINQVPGKECETEITMKSAKRRIYSSNNSLDCNITGISSSNLKQESMTNSYLWASHDKTRGSSLYLPGVSGQKSSSAYGTTRPKKGKSLKSHNYQKEITKAYDRIIGTVINSKVFRKKKYQCRIDNIVKSVDDEAE